MKVTALLPEELIKSVKNLTAAKTTTESIIIALSDWVSQKKLKRLTEELRNNPLRFKQQGIATRVRKANRASS